MTAAHHDFIRHLIDHRIEVSVDMNPVYEDPYRITFDKLSNDGIHIVDSDEDPMGIGEFFFYLETGACRLVAK